jgi:hypothetical protein
MAHRVDTTLTADAAMRQSTRDWLANNPKLVAKAAQDMADAVDRWALDTVRRKLSTDRKAK